MKTLEEQLKELNEKYIEDQKALIFESEIEKLELPGKVTTYNQSRINVFIEDVEDFKKIVELLPVTNTKSTVDPIGREYNLDSPYRLDIDNPCHKGSTFQITYTSNDKKIIIKMNILLISDFVEIGVRGVTDSEHVWYLGTSTAEINRIKLRIYKFKTSDQLNWYGGTKTTIDVKEISSIIKFLSK